MGEAQPKIKSQRENFTSQLGVIFAAAGSAIGIGNVWRFSYVVGTNGGGAFLLVYLICILLVGIPLMMAELAIGRATQKSAVPAFRQIAPKSFWVVAGALGVIAAFLILTYYPLVTGWSIGYMVEAIFNWGPMIEDPAGFFDGFVADPTKSFIVLIVALILTALTLVGGVAKGIEKWCKILMPMLIVIMCILIVRAVTLPGAGEGLKFLFYPDFSHFGIRSFIDALGHGFYSLSIGMAIMITYGSYIRKEENLVSTTISVTGLDVITALMAGVAIFPAVFAFGLQPDSGPGLAFITLPKTFSQMPFGQFFAALFFLLLLVSALASMMSLMQVLVAFLEDVFHMKRRNILIGLSVLLFACGIPSVLSFSVMSDFTILGLTYFDFVDQLSANVIVPITGLLTAIFVGYKYGARICQAHIKEGAKNPNSILIKTFPVLIKYVVPIAVILILLAAVGVFDFLSPVEG